MSPRNQPLSPGVPSPRFTALLLTALLVPFAVKLFAVEPYPAVILPSGAGKLRIVDGCFQHNRRAVFAECRDGSLEPVPPATWLDWTHAQHIGALFHQGFGLDTARRRVIGFHGTTAVLAAYERAGNTPENVAACREWIGERLGDDVVALVLRRSKVTRRLESKEYVKEEVVDERRFAL